METWPARAFRAKAEARGQAARRPYLYQQM